MRDRVRAAAVPNDRYEADAGLRPWASVRTLAVAVSGRLDDAAFGALLVFTVALAVRLVHVAALQQSVYADLLMGDAVSYDRWAQQIARGDWRGHGVFYQAPLYPYLLGVLYAGVGRSLLLVRVVQACTGAASCVLLYAAARQLVSARAGLLAGLALALNASAIFAGALLQKTALELLFVCLTLWLVARLGRDRSPWLRWWVLGLTVGLLALTRENAVIFLVPILAWAVLDREATWPARVARAVCVILGVIAIVAPVAMRNALIGRAFLPTTAQLGPNLYIGNHPGASGLYEPLRQGRGTAEFEQSDAITLAEQRLGRTLSVTEASRYWASEAVGFMATHPSEWLRQTVRKAWLLFNAAEIADTEAQESHAEYSPVLRLLGPITGFGLLVPLAAWGLVMWRQQWRRLWIVPMLVIVYAASVVMFFVLARYRYPLIPFLVLFAAAGVTELVSRWRQLAAWPRTCAVIGVATAALLANWPIVETAGSLAVTENNVGAALQAKGRVEEAVSHYRRALQLDAEYGDAYLNLGTVLAGTGHPADALAAFEQALQRLPNSERAHQFIGRVLIDLDQRDRGIDYLRRASELSPDAEDIHTELGAAFANGGRPLEALDEFRAAVRLAPQSPRVHVNLGMALLDTGNAFAAAEELRRALMLDATDAETWNRLGVALARADQGDAAVDAFQRAVAIDPAFADARDNLAAVANRSELR